MVTDNCHDAILFANQATSFTVDGLNGGQEIQSDSDVHTEGQTPRDSPEKMVTDNCHDAILFANQATSFTVDGLNGGQEIQSDVGIL
ncbi:hypothetical protein F2Q69_00023920 [Brassica cretica]|uniref:Uncharacterized protein n=1 Tax=Brassica cretica TaxID=69181 RepID=A0A8S9Q9X0_BRACR|nr:hypothetical protein F2Q69_00023920 [Brassica cretica]